VLPFFLRFSKIIWLKAPSLYNYVGISHVTCSVYIVICMYMQSMSFLKNVRTVSAFKKFEKWEFSNF
jgi:hypothetical protein